MTIHCADCGGELEGKAHFDEGDGRGLWLWCPDCDQSGDFAPEDVEHIDRGRGAATDGGEVTDGDTQNLTEEGRMQAFLVTARTEDDEGADASTFVVDATSEDAAMEQVEENRNDIRNTICAEPHSEVIEIEVRGSTEEMAEFLEPLAELEEEYSDRVQSRDPDADIMIEGHAGGAESTAVTVGEWRDVCMRIRRVRDSISDGDGIDMTAESFAMDDSVVEFIVGDRPLVVVEKESDTDE